MDKFKIEPKIVHYKKAIDFCKEFQIGKGDLVFVSDHIYQDYFSDYMEGAEIINYRKYGLGEPTDIMVENIYKDIKGLEYRRVIAIGGGTILDIGKLFALKEMIPVVDLFEKRISAIKDKQLVLIPTTCGTGSEVTSISILELTAIQTKFGLNDDAIYADFAVIIPELMSNIPFKIMATSSIDALVHSVESFLSPKATSFSKIFSEKAMRIIITVYKHIFLKGKASVSKYYDDLLFASTCAGIAFENAGCAAVHAMSYPLGAKYHVPHGESNYVFFIKILKVYQNMNPNGSIQELNNVLKDILECDINNVYYELEVLLNNILTRKMLRQYNVTKEDLREFTDSVISKQQRLLSNNYIPFDDNIIYNIYKSLY